MYYEKIGGFEVKAFFDSDKGQLVHKVTYRRKLLKTRVLGDRLSQSYIGHKLIIADLASVLSWGNIAMTLLDRKVQPPENKPILHSLFVSMLTTYWKCFADTKGRHGVQLNRKLVPKQYIVIHDELRRMRHNLAAHSGDDPFENGYVLYVEDVAGKSRFEPFVLPIHWKAYGADKKMIKNITELSKQLIDVLEGKQEKLLKRIMDSVDK
ncbi:hypothetical protein GSF04_16530 [Pseudoalteromonas sp. A22]|uniref:hypothetical protein n=1 Tax=Pseudoalteromonas sp. A22 TaxID=327511 RepID=UPI001BA43DE7|nr:hypothetical protein [Pseudoalteromonas sp. A22]QUI64002.1 hypothetical protein GSF04_16530 [Pseudoalteromonas sp. A22]